MGTTNVHGPPTLLLQVAIMDKPPCFACSFPSVSFCSKPMTLSEYVAEVCRQKKISAEVGEDGEQILSG